ncbi:MAG: hypothetical protein LKF35_01955 [Bifidobacterium minimum]|nr:hypothetical protein [Bifidobacterium minimum]
MSSGKRTTAYAVPRRPSPLGGRRPTKDDIDSLRRDPRGGVDDVLPADGSSPRLLIVGINPGLWTAAVNAPFAHPGNRFWLSLDRAGITDGLVDVSRGMSPEQADMLVRRGVAMTNLVARTTARADELGREELRTGGERLVRRVAAMRPRTRRHRRDHRLPHGVPPSACPSGASGDGRNRRLASGRRPLGRSPAQRA